MFDRCVTVYPLVPVDCGASSKDTWIYGFMEWIILEENHLKLRSLQEHYIELHSH